MGNDDIQLSPFEVIDFFKSRAGVFKSEDAMALADYHLGKALDALPKPEDQLRLYSELVRAGYHPDTSNSLQLKRTG